MSGMMAFFLWWAPPSILAVTLQVDSLAGVMSQPASSYFLLVYGSAVECSFSDSLFLRAMYVERPQFESQGFVEQEAGTFAFVGSQLARVKFFQMKAAIGYGKMQGWIQGPNDGKQEREGYALHGISVDLDAEAHFSRFSAGIRHQIFVGNATDQDLDSYVGWTFGFLLASIGFIW
jgi:hypothetical protein